ncbi:MAG TPA: metalloregulator ArsR/SmtB family transcription factor [Bacillota bacterium]|nr:metalloregulator ArsR/SmtB family transcription factor [Bacillota bacterium]
MEEYTSLFAAFSDKTRLRIMRVMLKGNRELCVCEVMELLEESQYNVSRHLKLLKNTGLLQARKKGRWVYYRLSNFSDEFQKLICQAILSLPSDPFLAEEKKLESGLTHRQDGQCDETVKKKKEARSRGEVVLSN